MEWCHSDDLCAFSCCFPAFAAAVESSTLVEKTLAIKLKAVMKPACHDPLLTLHTKKGSRLRGTGSQAEAIL